MTKAELLSLMNDRLKESKKLDKKGYPDHIGGNEVPAYYAVEFYRYFISVLKKLETH